MRSIGHLTQTHLSVLALNRDTHAPLARMPVYAEVSLVVDAPPSPLDLGEIRALSDEPFTHPALGPLLREALARAMDDPTYLALPRQRREELIEAVAELARDRRLVDLSDEARRIGAAEVVAEALDRLGIARQARGSTTTYSYPLGTLATDHAGYASFDLRRIDRELLRAGRTGAQYAFHLYPLGRESSRYNAVQQARFTRDAIFAKLELAPVDLAPMTVLNLPSMQNPALVDWYLSPGSFAAAPDLLIGADGCEKLVVAPVALREFGFRQVVRVTEPPDGVELPGDVRFGYVDEYRATWYALGHSLGEIQYSLPLAPGESVKLAVVDWAWSGESARQEETEFSEQLLHRTHRDRVITETVHATLQEWQRGGTVLGGAAGSVGASGTGGAAGIAGGATMALGGSYSTSSGSRVLAAENVHRLSDGFVQSSAAHRELASTVVIQSRQEERETIQTRTFTNHNRGHTLTILYYEVLRHYRVETSWVRRRPVALVRHGAVLPEDEPPADPNTPSDEAKVEATWAAAVSRHRPALEPYLRDERLRPGFAAVDRLVALLGERRGHGHQEPWAGTSASPPPTTERDQRFTMFEFDVTTFDGLHDEMTNDSENHLRIYAVKHDGAAIELVRDDTSTNFNTGGRLRSRGERALFFAFVPVGAEEGKGLRWGDLAGFSIYTVNDTWKVHWLAVSAFALPDKRRVVLIPPTEYKLMFGKYRDGQDHDDSGNNTFTTITPPQPDREPGQVPGLPAPRFLLTPEERAACQGLLDHIRRHGTYYDTVIALSRHPNEIAVEFEGRDWITGNYLDHLDPRPLDVFGSAVAYALLDGEAPDVDPAARTERLVTFPTRGVFAEGKLGHCTISEEIDNTRFWQWDQHPLPVTAPDINPATPVSPTPQAPPATTPTSFPSSVVSIVAPTAAPDPTGLAAALTAFATPNIFRDMSGRAEVADLLKKLSDNSIGIAEAARKAKELQQKYETDLATAQHSREAAALKALTEAKTPAQEAAARSALESAGRAADLEADLRRLAASGAMLSPAEQARVRDEILRRWTRPEPDRVRVTFHHTHAGSGERLNGEFDAVLTGGGVTERVPYTTVVGVGTVEVALPPGQYALAIEGRRTAFPATVRTRLDVPAVGTHPGFDVDLGTVLSPLRRTLSGHLATLSVPVGAKRVSVTVTAGEQSATAAHTVNYATATPVGQQAAGGLGTLLKNSDLATLALVGAVADGADKGALTVAYTYLTGALTVTAG
ncbi:hypothetical protein AWW66_10655 [Micromonospora rosaria]|uniref:Uncharacterized protein n=1 Tax=Micromonospora rosaria TaxID=47874 RepID=A0A136PV02_9ACTN|nr:hypothetical protein [Micromonospora rosaria]KXK61996.1 hypothetical protein AWW66_10655 [Micromonospora rosaria]